MCFGKPQNGTVRATWNRRISAVIPPGRVPRTAAAYPVISLINPYGNVLSFQTKWISAGIFFCVKERCISIF